MRSTFRRLQSAVPPPHRIWRSAVQLALPDVCAGCEVSGWWVCPDCAPRLRWLHEVSCCTRCGRPDAASRSGCPQCASWLPSLTSSRSVFAFDGPARASIHRLKFEGEPARAEWCARAMIQVHAGIMTSADLLVPVPLHPVRLRQRGYNQSEKIALAIARERGVAHGNVLERTRQTTSQVGLTADERWHNVEGAFRALANLDDCRILLIDDVLTTGATLQACADACLAAGAKEVRACTVAAGTLT